MALLALTSLYAGSARLTILELPVVRTSTDLLPDDREAGPRVRRRCVPAPVPASLQPYLAGPRRPRGRPDGAQRLALAPDAPPLRCQRPQRQSPPHLRPHHGRQPLKTPAPRQQTPAPGVGTGQAGTCALLHRAADDR